MDEEPKPKPKTLELCRADSWKARSKLSLLEPAPFEPEKQEFAYSPWRPAGPNTVQEPIAELCANACVALEIGNASSFQEALGIANAAREANKRSPLTVAFRPCTVVDAPPPAPPVSNGTSTLRAGATTVTGALSPEVVTGVLGGAHPYVQQCYETALTRNPALVGRVSAKLVIDETGAVVIASNSGSDLPDSALVACAIKAFALLRFPKPEKGIVTVVHPVLLEPNTKRDSKRDAG